MTINAHVNWLATRMVSILKVSELQNIIFKIQENSSQSLNYPAYNLACAVPRYIGFDIIWWYLVMKCATILSGLEKKDTMALYLFRKNSNTSLHWYIVWYSCASGFSSSRQTVILDCQDY